MICSTCRVAALRAAASSTALRAPNFARALSVAPLQRTRPSAPTSVFPRAASFATTTTSPRSSSRSSSSSSSAAAAAAAPEQEEEDALSSSMTPTELSIASLLRDKLTGPVTHLLVQDISGGCGSMYAIEVTAEDFRGKTMLKQQRMVNAALGDVIKGWHGVQIRTAVPDQ